MKPSSIYIFGAGGLGRELKALIGRLPEWQLQGFFDDNYSANEVVHGLPCHGGLADLLKRQREHINVVIALGEPALKADLAKKLSEAGNLNFPILVDPGAILLDKDSISLGAGSIVCAGAVLTADISIGRHTLINLNATIGHNAAVGDCCSIMPGANIAGNVSIAEAVLIGSGANVINGVHIARQVRVGAGAVVTRDVSFGKTVTGIPAREQNRS